MSYEPHQALIAPARASSSLARLVGGMVLLVAMFIFISVVVTMLVGALSPAEDWVDWAGEIYDGTTPYSVLFNLYSFLFLALALTMSLRLVHKRSLMSVMGPLRTAFGQFWRVLRLLLVLYAVTLLLPYPEEFTPSLHLAPGLWLLYLPLTLSALLVQTGTEELVFRGYLQSQLAARFRSPLLWIGLPSLLFGLLHYNPGVDPAAAWIIIVWAVMFGLVTADITARAGTLGPAIALHMANNTLAIALAAPAGNFDGLALYTVPISMSDTDLLLAWMPVEMLMMLCSWLVARLALRV